MIKQKLIKFSERIYYYSASHETDRPILGAVIGNRYVLMIDGGNSPEHVGLFLQELSRHGINKPSFVVLTHWHWDHIFGLSHLKLPIVAHQKTAENILRLQQYSWDDVSLSERVDAGVETVFCSEMIKKEYGERRDQIQIVSPTIQFTKQLTLYLGGITCRIDHVGGDHAEDSTVIYVEEEKFMFLGDCTSCDIYSNKRQYTEAKVLPLLKRLENYGASWYLHSHSVPISHNMFLQENRECRAIVDSMKKHRNNLQLIIDDVKNVFGRDLTREDIEFVQYFINGNEKYQ